MDCVSYIYLNTYRSSNGNEYFYVGSHTWEGPEGVLDPEYHGTSSLVEMYGWIPLKEEILEVCSPDRKFVAEHEWIEKYAKLYGVAVCVKKAFSKSGKLFVNKFIESYCRPDGKILNVHSNTGQQMLAGQTEESIKRRIKSSVETRRATGDIEKWRVASQREDVMKRSLETRHNNGAFDKFMEAGRLTNNNECKDYIASSIKGWETRKKLGVKPKRRIVSVSKDGKVLKEGSIREVCTYIGNANWNSYVSKKFCKGVTEVEHHGFLFQIIS